MRSSASGSTTAGASGSSVPTSALTTTETSASTRPAPQIVVRGRHTEVSERFRTHAASKLAGLRRWDHKLFRLDIEVTEEHNPRLAASCERIEITAYSRGPVVRAEAAATDAYAALDLAYAKLEERLRRSAERRHSRGSRVAHAQHVEANLPRWLPEFAPGEASANGTAPADTVVEGDEEGPFLVREKVHAASPMTLDEALAAMELVGHDFYLFTDVGSGCPSVVYRRRGYHYGVLRLHDDPSDAGAVAASNAGSDERDARITP